MDIYNQCDINIEQNQINRLRLYKKVATKKKLTCDKYRCGRYKYLIDGLNGLDTEASCLSFVAKDPVSDTAANKFSIINLSWSSRVSFFILKQRYISIKKHQIKKVA